MKPRYVKVQIENLKEDVYYGLVNIGIDSRTSDFFDRKFREGGNVQIVRASKNKGLANSESTTYGINAHLIVDWKPLSE